MIILALATGILTISAFSEPIPPRWDLEVAVPRVGTFLVGLAAVRARGSLHNHFPCPRRGLVHHGGNWAPRHVSLRGCDVGGRVVVEGEGTLDWPEPSPGAPGFCAIASPPVEGYGGSCANSLAWNGPLTIYVDGRRVATMERIALREIVWQAPVYPVPARRGVVLDSEALDIDAQRIRLVSYQLDGDGRTFRVDEDALPRDLFDLTTLDLESIPNPSGSLDALTEVDVQRLVLDGVLRGLGVLLIDEAMESLRGDHEHEVEGCGAWAVKYSSDPPEMRVDHRWTRCRGTPSHGLGLVWDGTFTALLRGIPDPPGGIDISLEGPLTIGGGVPTVAISKLLLHAEGDLSRGATSPLRVWGEIVGPKAVRPFDYELTTGVPKQEPRP